MPPIGGRPKSVAENGRYRWSLVHPVRAHRPTSHDPGRIDRLAPFSAAGRLSHGPGRNASLTHRPSTWPILPATSLCDFWAVRHRRHGAFGEIALPRRGSGKAEFAEGLWDVAQRASWVGTDLRAVRHRRHGAFGEIALPQKRPGECQPHRSTPRSLPENPNLIALPPEASRRMPSRNGFMGAVVLATSSSARASLFAR